ncbi:MAG: beta-propeller domain-containing protein [Candidatus Aenigmarchaeota archaeon]|nr:beta-propeller domain-containing protein [Candidatus Aenigmarchaeota archaeon]
MHPPARKGTTGNAPALVLIALLVSAGFILTYLTMPKLNPAFVGTGLAKFESCNAINTAFMDARNMMAKANRGLLYDAIGFGSNWEMATTSGVAPAAAPDYSGTNVQVAGVDEGDIVKTDGEYIYVISQGRLVAAKAYPAAGMQVLSNTSMDGFTPQDMFLNDGRLLLLGSSSGRPVPLPAQAGGMPGKPMAESIIYPYPYYSFAAAQLWDVSDPAKPEMLRKVELEGNYLSARMIGDKAYFITNSYPRYDILAQEGANGSADIVPKYFEDGKEQRLAGCGDIAYFKPLNPQSFITIASMSLADEEAEVGKLVVAGSGQAIYASLESLYVAQPSYGYWQAADEGEKTLVHKFRLGAAVEYIGYGSAPGHILNQFSMDEHAGNFRIATTSGQSWDRQNPSSNNVYVFDADMKQVGSLEGLAPGERIYSVRFMGEKAYLVTFKKVDPLFVLDLSDPASPKVLGKLKIPGYSDYLHPYDEDHIIGIGKEAVEAEEGDFAWYQGVKVALFDVSDVSNPKQLHNVIIGDRGTDSEVLRDHKAFLFDRRNNLLVLPILLAEIQGERSAANSYGSYTFQGAYVYKLTLDGGFELNGRVSHQPNDDNYVKSGYYFYDGGYGIRRSLYIDSVLYTVSEQKIKANNLATLADVNELQIGTKQPYGVYGTVPAQR